MVGREKPQKWGTTLLIAFKRLFKPSKKRAVMM